MNYWMLAVLGWSCTLGASAQTTKTFNSGPERVHLLELFTSEGCSSCPPAEAWLSRWKDHPELWKQVVPVAFHVDYWDYLGWGDAWARKEFSARQRDYALRGKSESVYTPEFIFDGREWRNWFREGNFPTGSTEKSGQLVVTVVSKVPGLTTQINWTPALPDIKPVNIRVALLGSDSVSEVKRGENGGRKLTHDFTVLDWQKLSWNEAASKQESTLFFSDTRGARAMAVWVETTEDGRILQATGGWLSP